MGCLSHYSDVIKRAMASQITSGEMVDTINVLIVRIFIATQPIITP